MLVVGINTAFNWTIKGGRIGSRRLREVGELLAAAPGELFKVVVAHHHLIPPPNFGSQRVLGHARRAMRLFAAAGVDLVLSGHQHQTYIGSSEDFYPQGLRPVIIVHSGTTTSSRGRAGERHRNTCNWIEVEARSEGELLAHECPLAPVHHRRQPGLRMEDLEPTLSARPSIEFDGFAPLAVGDLLAGSPADPGDERLLATD